MGHQANMKDLRKQLRNVVNEILPEVLGDALVQANKADLYKGLKSWMDFTTDNINKKLEVMDQRAKDVQSFVIRHVGTAAGTPSAKDGVAENGKS
jgi:hypothetical protein